MIKKGKEALLGQKQGEASITITEMQLKDDKALHLPQSVLEGDVSD